MKEEKLRNSMKNMFNNIKKDDEKDGYFFFAPKYRPQVKITDWFLPLEAEPKDNDPYHPPGGNYFVSTYHRLGMHTEEGLETTTQAMLRQICLPPEPPSPYRPMVTAATGRLARHREEDVFECRGAVCSEADFTSTYTYDYRHPFPYRVAHPPKTKEKPQKRFGLVSKFTPSKICETKFLDDQEANSLPISP